MKIRKYMIGLGLSLVSLAAYTQSSDDAKSSNHTRKDSIFVKSILQVDDLAVLLKKANPVLRRAKEKRYTTGEYFVSSTGGWGGDFQYNPSAEWDFIFGKPVNQYLSLGMGVSLSLNGNDVSGWRFENQHFAPIFAYGRYYLNDKNIKLFAYTKAGYGFPFPIFGADEHTGGMHFQPGLGLHFPAGKIGHLLITIGQNIQHTKINITSFDSSYDPILLKHSRWYNRTILKIGVSLEGL